MDVLPYPWTESLREQAQEQNGVISYEFVNYSAEVDEYFWFITFSNLFWAPFWYSFFQNDAYEGRVDVITGHTSFFYSFVRQMQYFQATLFGISNLIENLLESVPMRGFYVLAAPVVSFYVMLNGKKFDTDQEQEELFEKVLYGEDGESLTLEEGIYYHYLTAPILRWEKACNGACSESDLELLSNPFGIGAITQVFLADLLMFLPVGILSIPLTLIWTVVNGLYQATGLIARQTFDTFTIRPEEDFTALLNTQAYEDFNIYAFIFFPFKAYLAVIEAFFVALLNYVEIFFDFVQEVVRILLIPFQLIADAVLRLLVMLTIPFKILIAAIRSIWAVYQSLWEPMLRILAYPFLIVLQIFVLTFQTFVNAWTSIFKPFWTWILNLIVNILGSVFWGVILIIMVIVFWPIFLWEFLWPADEYCDRWPEVDSCREAQMPVIPLGSELIGLSNAQQSDTPFDEAPASNAIFLGTGGVQADWTLTSYMSCVHTSDGGWWSTDLDAPLGASFVVDIFRRTDCCGDRAEMNMYIDDQECSIDSQTLTTVRYNCFNAIGSTLTVSSKQDNVPVNFCGINVYAEFD